MQVSVIICTYDPDMYDHFVDAVESIRSQTYDNIELVLVIDGTESLYERVVSRFETYDDVILHLNQVNQGLLVSRNRAVELANGEIIAFMDDDAIADETWVEELIKTYNNTDAIATGGKMTGLWLDGKPDYLPEEYYWLVGVTHRGFAEGAGEIRNTFGSNLSFRREIFLELGGFNPNIGGRKGTANLQGGETELCARLREKYDRGVMYNPNAIVKHKVFDYRTRFLWLLDRAFWQGYSKRAMEQLMADTGTAEARFLRRLIMKSLPHRLKSTFRKPSTVGVTQLVMLFVFTGSVGLGYLYGILTW